MKKLFCPGIYAMITIFAILVSSCSKSKNDLVSAQKKSENEVVLPSQGKISISPIVEEGWSSIYSFINEPVFLKLGDPDNNLYSGDIAVFYVLISDEIVNNSPSSAVFNLIDDNKEEVLGSYNLISSNEAETYGITVPDKLAGQAYMFAIVEFNEQFIERTVSLHSEIIVNNKTSESKIEHAFSVRAN